MAPAGLPVGGSRESKQCALLGPLGIITLSSQIFLLDRSRGAQLVKDRAAELTPNETLTADAKTGTRKAMCCS